MAKPEMVPLYGFLEGDTLGLLMLAHDDMSLRELADRLRAAASVRVDFAGDAIVVVRGEAADETLTVATAGLRALDRFDVRRAPAAACPERG
jgi:hypothetical protein